MDKKIILKIVIGMIITIVIADLIIDALTPLHSQAFLYRLITNICIVIVYAIIYFKYKKTDGMDKNNQSLEEEGNEAKPADPLLPKLKHGVSEGAG